MDVRDYWAKIFWNLAGEKTNEYEALKRTEIFEFFRLLKIHEEIQVKNIKKLKNYDKDKH